MARIPYTIGIFQYSLLYAWPQPGINAERLVAIRGICLGTVSFLMAGTVTIESFEGMVSFFCTTANGLPDDKLFLPSCA